MRSLRSTALEKIAFLSVTSLTAGKQDAHINKISRRCPGTRTRANGSISSLPSRPSTAGKVPMVDTETFGASQRFLTPSQSLPEIEALLALCKAAPQVKSIEIAAQLLPQLTAYLPEAHIQNVSLPPSVPGLDPAPWEPLTRELASAVLSLGLNHPSLRQYATSTLDRYIANWTDAASRITNAQLESEAENDDDIVGGAVPRTAVLAVSILGFMDAAAKYARYWAPWERLRLIQIFRDVLSEQFMTSLETTLSIIRTRGSHTGLRAWKHYVKRYAASGRPLGAMLLREGFMKFMVSTAALQVVPAEALKDEDILDALFAQRSWPHFSEPQVIDIPVGSIAEIASEELRLLEEGYDFVKIGSAWQQRLASAVKADAFKCFLCCSIIDSEIADPETLVTSLEAIMSDPGQIADEYLASVVFKSMTVLARTSSSVAGNMARVLPRLIVHGGLDSKTSSVASQCLALILQRLPQDVTITTLYSLGNVLTVPGTGPDRNQSASPLLDGTPKQNGNGFYPENKTGGSVISLGPNEGEEPSIVHSTTIEAIVCIAWTCKVEKIIALAISMLIQKLNRISQEVDAKIITETAILAVHSAPNDLRTLLKLYSRLCHDALVNDNVSTLEAVTRARLHLSQGIKRGSENFEIYTVHLLDSIVSKGDAHEGENKHEADIELATQEIAQLLQPLAAFAMANAASDNEEDLEIEGYSILQRDAWFNAVVHGFTLNSPLGKKYRRELQILARFSQPLVPEDRADQLESDIELNTTLRRGKSSEHTADHKKQLIEVLPSCEPEIRSLNYSETIFLTAAYLVENLRASAGDCTKVLIYFLDPRLRSGPMGKCMSTIAAAAVKTYLSRTLAGKAHSFSSPYVAQQLAIFFVGCCHRISKVQQVATTCADLIISQVPSSLCHQSALFALLDLLTIMWDSCLERETDEYEWTPIFKAKRGNVEVELSDDFSFRRATLNSLQRWAKTWIQFVIDIAPLDIKGLIQTYLSEFDDEGAYGHVSLGRSFALEMGGAIPATDQRLGALDMHQGVHINTASDFIAQYTTRQEYRFVGAFRDDDQEWIRTGADSPFNRTYDKSIQDASGLLADLEARTLRHQQVSIAELRDVLRRAGALLCCSTDKDQGAIVHHLVDIPFAVFTKQSIKLGISLWMGVIKENARMESRILVEIAENWEETVRMRRGLFDKRLHHYDPFYIKEEFAPSDRELIIKRQHAAYDLIAPHLRLLQFLSSHFSASRLGCSHIQKVYQRLITMTLDALANTRCHPLARECHFHVILLGLRILRASTDLDHSLAWRFKDRLLTAALAWFAFPPRWTYGGNRLQVKAEVHIMGDIQMALGKVQSIGSSNSGSTKSLQAKQELLLMLLTNEQARLMVWLFPMDERKNHFMSSNHRTPTDNVLSSALKTAWAESPALAVHIAHRFNSAAVTSELRWLLLNFPDKVLDQPDALEILLGPSLPSDVSFQLKYLLYWGAVNPITAVTYFLPAYGNHPFIIQYAMRALESHSVDITFFYVPQIVQALRYDVLGYVERYIIDTSKFSQLFAHQIIWNMKANSYKDDDAQEPDAIKPTLDKVTEHMISSWSREDKDFFEREFAFFNEVTDISGKLKPYIKKSKPEKKQKIEEELRKIKVDVGVYLPSNPDGVVVGIDRKSGRPLQSHAKAPYMATFRIRKEKADSDENEEELRHAVGKRDKKETVEIWQSAIFKVGDDCRQDVLALQLISAFRGIFHNVGLDVYVNPYRVTATAPGCGVIDVLPNSISRDMLGREAVNGLYDYFISKFGGEDSIRFQEARNNFVKSMAAYSVISWLLQFKDRHNGNIMIDDAGHILHVDFGFCFDIVPGGVKFERAPFKLTKEMVAVMGGPEAQSYKWFEELCCKAFLASRQHCEHLVHMVIVMLDSGLPCFKPTTIQNMKSRFVLEKSEREAAEFMRGLIAKSYDSFATKGYDQFQLLTNGIPY